MFMALLKSVPLQYL